MKDESGLIFDIQRFSLHDGPGIRTVIFFKGCPIDCAWCQNPESKKITPEIAFYSESCHGCFKCKSICPDNAIIERSDKRIDADKCTVCGKCVVACVYHSLRMVGHYWDAKALVREIEKDRDFFDDSGGGITLSGGEPMQQHIFLAKLVSMIKETGLHLNLETSGMFKQEHMEKILPHLDLLYFDLKHMDETVHRKYTGCGNALILENFAFLSQHFIPLQARMPVIPGINDDIQHIRTMSEFLKHHGHNTIHLLPYHDLGESKIPRIETMQHPLNKKSLSPEEIEPVKDIFQKEGIHAVVYN